MPLPRPAPQTDRNGSSSSAVSTPGLLSEFPELWAFLTLSAFPDGSRRQTGRMSFSYASGTVTVSLTDTHTGTYVCRTGKSPDDALQALESGLRTESLDWMASRYSGARRSRKT